MEHTTSRLETNTEQVNVTSTWIITSQIQNSTISSANTTWILSSQTIVTTIMTDPMYMITGSDVSMTRRIISFFCMFL